MGLGPSARKEEALTMLYRGVNSYLNQLGVSHALSFGTLLGWHRNGKFLPHDKDVDFTAPVEAYPLIWQSRAKLPRGFKMYDTSVFHGKPKLYIRYRGWEADIYFEAQEQGMISLLIVGGLPGDALPFPRELMYPLQSVTFLGEQTFVPAKAEALLKHHYGYIGPNAELDPVTQYYRPRKG